MSNKNPTLRFNDKLERLKHAKAKRLEISYESLKRKFGDKLSSMLDELADYTGMDRFFLPLIITQNFDESGKALITHSGISFEEIDDFFRKKMEAVT